MQSMISTEFLMIKVNNISIQNKLALLYWLVIEFVLKMLARLRSTVFQNIFLLFSGLISTTSVYQQEKQNQPLSKEQLTKFLLLLKKLHLLVAFRKFLMGPSDIFVIVPKCCYF